MIELEIVRIIKQNDFSKIFTSIIKNITNL